MRFLDRLVLNIKRGESLPYRLLRRALKWALITSYVPVPRILRPGLRLLYELHFLVIVAVRRMAVVFYRQPLFYSRCASVGKNLKLSGPMPFVRGQAEIHIGDDVALGGPISIHSGRFVDRPRLMIGDGASIGQNTVIVANKEVVIEEGVIVSPHCRIADSDGHAREADLRAQGEPMRLEDIRPVRIGRNAWVATGCQIMKGVTIGEGALIGANSVVISNIPPYSLAMGNPAEVFLRNVGKPKKQRASAVEQVPGAENSERYEER